MINPIWHIYANFFFTGNFRWISIVFVVVVFVIIWKWKIVIYTSHWSFQPCNHTSTNWNRTNNWNVRIEQEPIDSYNVYEWVYVSSGCPSNNIDPLTILPLLLFRNIIIKIDISNYKHLLMKHFARIRCENWLLPCKYNMCNVDRLYCLVGYVFFFWLDERAHACMCRLNNNCIPCLRTITINLNLSKIILCAY